MLERRTLPEQRRHVVVEVQVVDVKQRAENEAPSSFARTLPGAPLAEDPRGPASISLQQVPHGARGNAYGVCGRRQLRHEVRHNHDQQQGADDGTGLHRQPLVLLPQPAKEEEEQSELQRISFLAVASRHV